MTHQSPHDKSADAVHEGRPVEAQYVRGGRGGVRILTLLVISAGAAAILLLGMWFVSQGGFARTNANIGDQAVDAQAFGKEGAAPSTADAPPPTAARQPAEASPAATPNPNAPVTPAATPPPTAASSTPY